MMNENNENLSEKELRKQQMQARFEEWKANLKNPVQRAVRVSKASHVLVGILRFFLLFGLSFIIVYPIFREIIVAIKDPVDLNNPLVTWVPEHFSLVNIKIAVTIMDYWNALKNNIKISLLTSVIQVFITSLAGYAFARLRFKGSNILFWMVMLCLLIPPQTIALSRSLYFTHFDILGLIKLFNNGETISLRGEGKDSVLYIMAFFGQGIRASLFIYLFRQTFRGLPLELEESAQIDGAGVIKTYWSVMLPNARGTVTTVALFAFVWQWNDAYYVKAYGISGDSFPLMTMYLLNIAEWISGILMQPAFKHLLHMVGDEVGQNPFFTSAITNTAAFLMMLPLLIGYLFVQRSFIEGVERSGIVG